MDEEKNEKTLVYSVSCRDEAQAQKMVDEINRYIKNVLGHSNYKRAYIRKDIRVYLDRKTLEATYEVCKDWGLFEKEKENGSQKTSN